MLLQVLSNKTNDIIYVVLFTKICPMSIMQNQVNDDKIFKGSAWQIHVHHATLCIYDFKSNL